MEETRDPFVDEFRENLAFRLNSNGAMAGILWNDCNTLYDEIKDEDDHIHKRAYIRSGVRIC